MGAWTHLTQLTEGRIKIVGDDLTVTNSKCIRTALENKACNAVSIKITQAGTGKTFTMEGVRSNPELKGIIPNSFAHIFRKVHAVK